MENVTVEQFNDLKTQFEELRDNFNELLSIIENSDIKVNPNFSNLRCSPSLDFIVSEDKNQDDKGTDKEDDFVDL